MNASVIQELQDMGLLSQETHHVDDFGALECFYAPFSRYPLLPWQQP